MADEVIALESLKKEEVPEELRVENYFDFEAHPFAHEALFKGEKINSVFAVIPAISDYAKAWLKETIARLKEERKGCLEVRVDQAPEGTRSVGRLETIVEKGAIFKPAHIRGAVKPDKPRHSVYVAKDVEAFGCDIYLDNGDIYIGEGTTIDSGVCIKGPTIIGKKNEIRQGAYFRGDVITGDGCTFRGELKNAVMMDRANFPHPSYIGDSICGYMTHFGNGATAANLGIFQGLREPERRNNLVIQVEGKSYNLGRPKMGIIMGDYSQVGCNSVSDPGTFLLPNTIVYSLTRISKGCYGPNEILKNKPMEHGVIERAPLESR